jgi:endonuclease/exonuclease/phosphatase family metal-dependent hydrolase
MRYMLCSLLLVALFCTIDAQPPEKVAIPLAERKGDLSVATWNLEWFYDWDINDNQSETAKINSAPSRKDWEWRLKATADAIAKMKPTVLCLQEIENKKVLDQLCVTIKERHRLDYEVCFAQGRDSFTEQDVGVLVLRGLRPQFRRAPEPRNWNSREMKPLTKQLMVEIPWGDGPNMRRLTFINVHLMAGDDIGKEMDRCDQARFIKRWIEDEHKRGHYVVLMGDLNTAEVRGNPPKEKALDILAGKDTPDDKDDDLEDVTNIMPVMERITFGSRGSMLDHIFISPKLKNGPGIAFDTISNRKDVVIRGEGPDFKLKLRDRRFWKIDEDERDLSDHYPLLAKFRVK